MTAFRRGFRRVKDLLSKEQTQILETAFLLMLPVILSKVFGQVFQLLLASTYGLDDSRLNQFFIANAIPELLTTVLMVGAIGTVTIPILISVKEEEGKEAFYKVFSSLVNASILLFAFIGLLLVLFADNLIPAAIQIVNPEIPPTDAEVNNIVWMMRALIIPQFILGISVFISTGLNVYDRYLLPQLSPLFFNVGRIVAFVVLVSLIDKSPWAIVAGAYIGAFFHLIIQIPLFIHLRITYYLHLNLHDKNIRDMIKLGLPRIIVLASDHVGFLINNFIAVAFIAGPAALNFAKSLYLLIPSLFGYTFSYASYPTLARLFHAKKFSKIADITQKTLHEIFFMAIPFIVVLLVLRVPVVRLVYGILPGTSFSLEDTYQVAWLLLFFSFGLAFITARWFLFSLFYAARDTLIPAIITIGTLIILILTSVLFTNFLSHTPDFALSSIEWNVEHFFERSDIPGRAGVGGIALAMSFTYTIEFIVMFLLFHKTKIKMNLRAFVQRFARKFVAGGAMFFFLFFTYQIWDTLAFAFPESAESSAFVGSTTINLLILTTITVIPAFMIYYLVCHLLKVEELKILGKYLNPVFKLGGLRIRG